MSRKQPEAQIQSWDHLGRLNAEIQRLGGYVNAHAHPGRAYTSTPENLALSNRTLKEKWSLVDKLKRESTVNDYVDRMDMFVLNMLAQGALTLGCFIDIDEVVKAKEMEAITKIRARYKGDVEIVTMNQTLKGVLDPGARAWFNEGAEFVDIIGGLPAKDGDRADEAFDVLMGTAKELGKPLHVHVDQNNQAAEGETLKLVEKTEEFGMQGRVVAIHGISIAAHPKEYRDNLYQRMVAAQVGLIVCPWAWIDSRRTEELQPSHNSIAPIDELLPAGVLMAVGTDNIADLYLPLNSGDMADEMHLFAAACHYYNMEELAKCATENGRKLLFLPPIQNSLKK